MAKKIRLILFVFSLIAFTVTANFVFAQSTPDTFGIEQTNNSLNGSLGQVNTSPIVVIGRIIQIVLSFLGLLALILTIYAGWLWMSSGGEESKVAQAKQILRNAVIGLIIILSSWGIATFVLSKFSNTSGGSINNPSASNINNLSNPGIGAIGACSVSNFYPEDEQKDVARNSSIIISFKEEVKASSVCVNDSGNSCECGLTENGATCNKINPQVIRIYKTDLGDACASGSCPGTNANVTDVNASISGDKKTIILTPLSYLGNPTSNVSYSVKISNGLKKIDDSSMFKTCSLDYFNWKFEISNRLDLSSPQVVYGKIFPRPDNEEDIQNKIQAALAAQSVINFEACPNTYSSSSIVSVSPIEASPAASATALNYQGNLTKFRIYIPSESKDKAQLFDGNDGGNLLGSADFDAQGNAKFSTYFIFKAPERNSGNSWLVTMNPEKPADTLTIGDEVYTFTSGPLGNNNIPVVKNCAPEAAASVANEVLSGSSIVNSSLTGNSLTAMESPVTGISLVAKIAGASGNDIVVKTTNPVAIKTQAFKNGIDKQDLAQVIDKKDVPMNTIIQVNFNEAINPLKISGLASEVKDYIKVVNHNDASLPSGSVCVKSSDCLSYKCEGPIENKKCVGDYVDGKFLVSNSYRTVEFVSNNECGVNGCGEKIYCLPANSVLSVQIKSADLKTCNTNEDCSAFAPYSNCADSSLGYKTCQNADGKNHPSSGSSLNGIIDSALNSLDGDRDKFADGPQSFYSDNYDLLNTLNQNKKDNYRWHFYVNDKINLTPPQIESITPVQGAMGISLADPIKISWNTLMMNSSLVTGSNKIKSGTVTTEHKLINLRSVGASGLGYWIDNENIDTEPFDGEPDKTISWIKHTPFSESMSYRAQAGSGVKDIYQNCFKPSASVSCPVTEDNPSCCFGKATSTLSAEGNCQ